MLVLVVAAAALIFVTRGSDDDDDTRTSARSDLDSGSSCAAFAGVVSQADVERYLSGDAGGGTVNMVPAGLRRRQVDSGTLGECEYTFDGHIVEITLRRASGDLTPAPGEEALGGLGDAAVYDTTSPRVSVLDRDREIVLSVLYPSGFAVETRLAMLAEFVLDRLPAHIGG